MTTTKTINGERRPDDTEEMNVPPMDSRADHENHTDHQNHADHENHDKHDFLTRLRDRIDWFSEARPADYLMALSDASTALPVVGKHFEPLAMITAMGVWGSRHAPSFLSTLANNVFGARDVEQEERDKARTNEICFEALTGIVSDERLAIEWPAPDGLPPVLRTRQHRREYVHRTSVQYGDSPEQVMDIWRREDLPAEPAPVLLFVPGGAWVHGRRALQGHAIMAHLAAQGWVCLSIDYRVAPQHPWPRHITDVKTAVAWARANADQFGGDREFVAIAGCSAGGHLAALAGLTHDDDEFHEDLHPYADTSVDAVVGIYGRYDWEDRSTHERELFMGFLENVVVRKRHEHHPELFRSASPIARVRPDAPPFLVIHGDRDSLIPVEQARDFVEQLRATSRSSVGYVELPGTGHGFDMLDGARTASVATAVGLFLDEIHRKHIARRAKKAI